MEFRWMKTGWLWFSKSWLPNYLNLWNDLFEHSYMFFATIFLLGLQTLHLLLEVILRPLADIFKLGFYYNEK